MSICETQGSSSNDSQWLIDKTYFVGRGSRYEHCTLSLWQRPPTYMSAMPDRAEPTITTHTSASARHTCSFWTRCQSMRKARGSRSATIKLRRLLTDSDMFDMPALRLQPFLGDVSCRRLLRSPSSKSSCLLGAVSVKGAFSVCGAFTGQLGRDDFATQEAAVSCLK